LGLVVNQVPKILFLKPTHKYRLLAWVVLLLFTVGQANLYAHRHSTETAFNAKHPPKSILSSYCPVCDAMHHSMGLPGKGFVPFVPVIAHHYKVAGIVCYYYQPSPLSTGRAPPLA
jgi:hypothetical protein